MTLEHIKTLSSVFYAEQYIYALLLEIILFVLNITVYKRKLFDYISLMLLSGIFMVVMESLWTLCEGRPELRALTYLGGCGYSISVLAFAIYLNQFLNDQFGVKFERKWLRILLYYVPFGVFTLLCITTPFTKLVFEVTEDGIFRERVLFDTLIYVLDWGYIFAALIPTIYYLFPARKKNPVAHINAKYMLIFGMMVPLVYSIQWLLLGTDSNDYIVSWCVALPMVYLTTVINIRSLLESQAKNEAIESQLRIASRIQTDALPAVAPKFAAYPELNLRASMDTAKEVGGDFYDYFSIDEHKICFLIADVSGKGVPAALFMMTAKTMIRDCALNFGNTAEIFTAVNARLCENNKAGMFATAWIGILDMRTMTLQYTNAGHNYPLLLRDGKCRILKKRHGLILAGMDDTMYRQDELKLCEGDRLLLYTDGITEARNPTAAMYGEDRLIRLIEETGDEPGEDVLKKITEDVNKFVSGAPQFDDMTMVVLTIE